MSAEPTPDLANKPELIAALDGCDAGPDNGACVFAIVPAADGGRDIRVKVENLTQAEVMMALNLLARTVVQLAAPHAGTGCMDCITSIHLATQITRATERYGAGLDVVQIGGGLQGKAASPRPN